MGIHKAALLRIWADLQHKADKLFGSAKKREFYVKARVQADAAYIDYLEAHLQI